MAIDKKQVVMAIDKKRPPRAKRAPVKRVCPQCHQVKRWRPVK